MTCYRGSWAELKIKKWNPPSKMNKRFCFKVFENGDLRVDEYYDDFLENAILIPAEEVETLFVHLTNFQARFLFAKKRREEAVRKKVKELRAEADRLEKEELQDVRNEKEEGV